MGRNWSPKHACACRQCGWKGKRTGRTLSNPCPRCGGMVERTALGKAIDSLVRRPAASRAGRVSAVLDSLVEEYDGEVRAWLRKK
jgi:hypothetical protein